MIVLTSLIAGMAGPQDLPPGVLLVSQIKDHTKNQLTHMLDYTCLETIHRYHKPPRRDWETKPKDTVRLEVLYAGKKEMYSAPGDRHFTDDHPSAFSSGGMSQDGLFGMYLYDVVVSGAALFTYRGEEDLAGRRAAKYDYRVSAFQQPLTLTLGERGQGVVGIKGAFWADPVSLDVLRLSVEAYDIPPSLPVESSVTVMNYAPVRIGDRLIMLAQSAEGEIEMTSGEADRNLLELTHCRSFETQSNISFTPPEPEVKDRPLFAMPGADFASASQGILAGLRVSVTLSDSVSVKTAVGTLIEGRVASAVVQKGGKTAIPAGAVVRGRVRRVERQSGPDETFLVALEFCDIEMDGTRQRFYADLESADRTPGVEVVLTTDAARAAKAPPNLPGVGNFLVRGGELPKGFGMVWKTQSMTE